MTSIRYNPGSLFPLLQRLQNPVSSMPQIAQADALMRQSSQYRENAHSLPIPQQQAALGKQDLGPALGALLARALGVATDRDLTEFGSSYVQTKQNRSNQQYQQALQEFERQRQGLMDKAQDYAGRAASMENRALNDLQWRHQFTTDRENTRRWNLNRSDALPKKPRDPIYHGELMAGMADGAEGPRLIKSLSGFYNASNNAAYRALNDPKITMHSYVDAVEAQHRFLGKGERELARIDRYIDSLTRFAEDLTEQADIDRALEKMRIAEATRDQIEDAMYRAQRRLTLIEEHWKDPKKASGNDLGPRKSKSPQQQLFDSVMSPNWLRQDPS